MDVEMGLDGIIAEESAAIQCSTRREVGMMHDALEFEKSMQLIVNVQETLIRYDATPAMSIVIFQSIFNYLENALAFSEPKIMGAMEGNAKTADCIQSKCAEMRSTLQEAKLHMLALQESLDEKIKQKKEKNKIKSSFVNFFGASKSHH